MEPDQISTLIMAFLGAAAGGIVGAIGFLYRQSEASKKEYRRLLFELMGIYQAFSAVRSVTPRTYIQAYFDVLSDMGYSELKNQEGAREFLTSLVAPQVEQLLAEMGEWSEERYTERVAQVAELSPVLAHSLKANVQLKQVVRASKEFLNDILTQLERLGVNSDNAEPALSKAEYALFGSILKELERDIMRIARSCGPIELVRTVRWLNRRDVSIEDRIRPFVAELVASIEGQMSSTDQANH